MLTNRYSNFVRPSSPEAASRKIQPSLSGEDARKLYLEEIKEAGNPTNCQRLLPSVRRTINKSPNIENVSKKELFLSAQNNDVSTLKQILDVCPNMLNMTDDYGWSLLMIACQANSVEAAKELMDRKIDTSVRDKAGNSAQSLVIKNRNLVLADILLSHKSKDDYAKKDTEIVQKRKRRNVSNNSVDKYFCDICNKEFPDKEEHLSSTVHNIDASKGKKIPSSYVIPSSNKGYQMMIRVGWDRESGLGRDGSGKKYPIKTVQKQDRKGLGLDKRKNKVQEEKKDNVKHINRRLMDKEFKQSKIIEVNFRRQFY